MAHSVELKGTSTTVESAPRFLARWPGKITPGSQSSHISAFWDILATMAELTNQKVPDQSDGISFLAELLGRPEDQEQHSYLYWEHPQTKNRDRAVRMGKWKAVSLGWKKKPPGKLELYDLEKDPGEKNNIASHYPEIVERIEKIMQEAHRPLQKKIIDRLSRQACEGENEAHLLSFSDLHRTHWKFLSASKREVSENQLRPGVIRLDSPPHGQNSWKSKNAQSGLETLQDYRNRQNSPSQAGKTPPLDQKERQAQKEPRQSRPRIRCRCTECESQHALGLALKERSAVLSFRWHTPDQYPA